MQNNLLKKITKNGRTMFLAYDQGMEHGPTDFNDESVDPAKILEIADSGYFTGVIFQKGVAEKYYNPKLNKVPLIVKLNGKTNLLKNEEPYSPLLCTVSEAKDLGALAVGYTIYVGSHYERKMMVEFSQQVEEEAEKYHLPVIAWMYPRGKAVSGRETSKEILAYAARLGLELGADIVKIPYTGSSKTFSWVVKSAGKTKVVVSGGPKLNEEALLRQTEEILQTGAIGLAVGRNIWQAENPLERAKKLAEIIYV